MRNFLGGVLAQNKIRRLRPAYCYARRQSNNRMSLFATGCSSIEKWSNIGNTRGCCCLTFVSGNIWATRYSQIASLLVLTVIMHDVTRCTASDITPIQQVGGLSLVPSTDV